VVFGDGVEFTLAPGGMALWVRLRMSFDVDAWARRSLQRGVSWYTGLRYAFDGQSKPFARFSSAWLNERELPEAVKRMAAARPARSADQTIDSVQEPQCGWILIPAFNPMNTSNPNVLGNAGN